MSESIRSFLAVDVTDPDIKRGLVKAQKALGATGADLRAVEEQNIHFTLRFFGEASERLIDQIVDQLDSVEFRPFMAEVRGIGVFPGLTRPRVIWAGCRKGESEFMALYSQIGSKLSGLHVRPDDNEFHPHITLARVRSGRNRDQLTQQITKLSEELFGEILVDRFQLKKSTLTPRGPVYSNIREFNAKGL